MGSTGVRREPRQSRNAGVSAVPMERKRRTPVGAQVRSVVVRCSRPSVASRLCRRLGVMCAGQPMWQEPARKCLTSTRYRPSKVSYVRAGCDFTKTQRTRASRQGDVCSRPHPCRSVGGVGRVGRAPREALSPRGHTPIDRARHGRKHPSHAVELIDAEDNRPRCRRAGEYSGISGKKDAAPRVDAVQGKVRAVLHGGRSRSAVGALH